MGIANDLKGLTMVGRFAPNSIALWALLIVILQVVYNSPALAKPRPQQLLNTKQWTGRANDRHWLDIDSIGSTESQRQKRNASEHEDLLKDQKGFKVLTASTEKREGIQTPIEAIQSQDATISNHGDNLRSKVNPSNGGRSGTETQRPNADSIPTQIRSGISISQPDGDKPSGSSVSTGNNDANGEKRGEVSSSNSAAPKSEGSKTQVNNIANNNNIDSKQESATPSAAATDSNNNKGNDKPNANAKPLAQESQANPHSVTIQGNTINGRPMSSSNSEPVRDPLGNSGSEVVTSHPLFEDRTESARLPYRDTRSKDPPKEYSEPEIGHFQVDDKSADLEINANSAGVKVKAKPASLQVVSRPGAHPPTPIVPIAPVHPYYNHHHYPRYHPYFDGYRRSMRPYHRRLYNNPYHAHYRAWIPPPGHRYHRYWRHYHDDEPPYRRSYEPYHHHHHHQRHHNYPDLYDRSNMEDTYDYPRYRRRLRGPYRRQRKDFGDFDTRLNIPRGPGPYVRHDIITPVPPPVNVYGNPPPGILNAPPTASFFGSNQISPFSGLPNMGGFGPGMLGPGMLGPGMLGPGMLGPGMLGPGMAGPGMAGPEMAGPGLTGPGMNGLGMYAPGMAGTMDLGQGLGGQPEVNGFARTLAARNVKKTSIQREKKKAHHKKKSVTSKNKAKQIKKTWKKFLIKSHDPKSTTNHSNTSSKVKHRTRRSADAKPKTKKTAHKLRPQKTKQQKGARKNSIVIHRPPIIYHPPPEIYHRPDIVVHRAPIMLHRPAIIYHQPPVVVHRPAIIYHQPSIVFHQPPPVVHQTIMHSHDTYVTRPVVYHSSSMVSHPTNYLGIPNHVYSGDFDGGFHGGYHGYHGFHDDAFRKHSVPHALKTAKAEIQGKVSKKSDTNTKEKVSRHKRDVYTDYLEHLDSMSSTWASNVKRNTVDEFDALASKGAASEALTYRDGEIPLIEKRDHVNRVRDKESRNHRKRDIDDDDDDIDASASFSSKKKKDVVVNRPPIIYHPPPEVYHRPDIVVHRPPLVIHRPPIIYHQPPVIVHRPAVVYHQPPIIFHQPPPAVSQPLLFSHDSFTVHPSFYATHHGSVVRDYGHYIGIPNIVSNYGAPLFHTAMGKRSGISKPSKKAARKSTSQKANKKSKLHKKNPRTEKPHKKNSVVIRRPPIIYHPPPEIYHRPDIVVHRAPIMIHRAPIVYHQPPVVVHRPAIVYHQPSIVFHQPPPVVHQPMIQSHDTWVTHSVAVPIGSHVLHHTAYIGIPKHAYMNYHNMHWDDGGHGGGHAFYKSQVPSVTKASQRDEISKHKNHKKTLKHKEIKEEKAKRKNSVVIRRPPIIYHPPPEIFHRPNIIVHRPPILVHRAPIVYHQPPVIVHRPAIVYHQPSIVFHQPLPFVHQPILQSRDTWVTRPVVKLYGSTLHRLGAVTQIPHAYFNGHHHTHYMAYGKSNVPADKKEEEASFRDEIKHAKVDEESDEGSGSASGSGGDDDDEYDDDVSGIGSAELDIEVVQDESTKSKLHKSKPRTEGASKKDKIETFKVKESPEKTVKGSKKNSVVIHRPPIIYHPPPEIYHRPDIVVHRAPIVLYRAPIIYHQPPVVVHRPAIVYHQPSIVFHQPPPVVHQPIMHAHDTYVTHSVVVPVGSHLSHVGNYRGVPHEEIFMDGIGRGAFAKSMLPLRKSHKRDKIKKTEKVRSRRAAEDIPPAELEDSKQPIGAGERVRRSLEQPWDTDLGEDVNIVIKRSESSTGSGRENSGNTLETSNIRTQSISSNDTDVSHNHNDHSKKTIIIIRRPPILYHPPSHVIHRPNIMMHRPSIIVHRHPLIIHRPSILVHRMPIVIHRPPILIHRRPMIVHRPDLVFHRPPVLIHRMPYVIHPRPWFIRRPPIVIHKGPHMMIHHSSYIHHYPSHVIHMGCHGCGCGGGMCGKSTVPKLDNKDVSQLNGTKENVKNLSDKFASDLKIKSQGIKDTTGNYKFSSTPDSDPEGLSSFDFKISEDPLKQTEGYYPQTPTNRDKRSVADIDKRSVHGQNKKRPSKKKKKDVVVSRPPIIYHPPPEVYHRPEIVVHRAPILIHRPPIIYHQPPVVVHRPAVVYHQPPIIFHQPPPAVNQPLLYSHDQYVLHPASIAQHINSVVNEGGHYIGIPHGGIENFPGSMVMQPFGHTLPSFSPSMPVPGYSAGYKRAQVQRPDNKDVKKSDKDDGDKDDSSGSSSGDSETPLKKSKPEKTNHSKGERKNNVLVYRPPMIYHPPPEIYDRPDVVVHRPDIVVHRPSIVYHQSSIVIHRPAIIYSQPPVVFHQPPPLTHQPIVKSHDLYTAHQYYEPYASDVHHVGSYTGAPHFYPGDNAYGWGMQQNEPHGPELGAAVEPPVEPIVGPAVGPAGPAVGPAVGPPVGPPVEPVVGPEVGPAVGQGFGPFGPSFGPSFGPAEPGFGPFGPGFGPAGPGFGPAGPGFGPAGPGFGPAGTGFGPAGQGFGPFGPGFEPAGQGFGPGFGPAEPAFAPALGPAFGRSVVEKGSKKTKKHGKKYSRKNASKKSKKEKVRRKRSSTKYHRHFRHEPVYSLTEHHESFFSNPLSPNYNSESSARGREPMFTKSKVTSKNRRTKRTIKSKKGKVQKNKQKKGVRKNVIVVHRPPMVYHPPPEIYDRPDVVVHRPDLVFHRPSIVYHQSSVVLHRPPIVYHEPPVVFHQPPPMVHQPVVHSHDSYVAHGFYEPYGSHVEHAGTYVGAPHFYPPMPYAPGTLGPAFGKSKIAKGSKKKGSKHRSRRSTNEQKKVDKTASKKNKVLIMRPPLIYHPPPEIYDRPSVIVHRPDLVIHRPSIVYHQASVVIHRPPIIYQQPPVVFHQPPPMNSQPVIQRHDYYAAHTFQEPYASHIAHAGTYVGAPHHFPGGWGYGYHSMGNWAPAFAKSKVPTPKSKSKKVKRNAKKSSKKHSVYKKRVTKGEKKNLVVAHRPAMIYHPPPEIYDRPDIVVHRPDIVIHQPAVVYHQSSVVLHRPPIIYHQPPVVFHQPSPAVHQPILHSHDTYIGHSYYEPHSAFTSHAGTYVGAPHYYGGGFGYGYNNKDNGFAPAYAKSEVSKSSKRSSKAKKDSKGLKRPKRNKDKRRHFKGKKSESKDTELAHKKNLVIMRRPSVVYHPPPEIYHRPDVILHRPDIVIHRPSVVFHQPAVVLHRPAVIYHQPPIVFHQPPPMVHQPVMHSHEAYLPHHYYEPHHSHVTHAGTYVGAPHFFHGGWGWGYGYHADHAFGKSKVEEHGNEKSAKKMKSIKKSSNEDDDDDDDDDEEDDDDVVDDTKKTKSTRRTRSKVEKKTKKAKHHKSKRDIHEHGVYSKLFQKFLTKRSAKGTKKDISTHSHLNAKKTAKGDKKNTVLIHRPPMIYHPPPEIYDRPNIIVHRPDLVYHQPSVVYHQSSVVIHRPPIIYHPPPVVFHQPPPMVHQNILHSHESYAAHQYFEPYASQIHGEQTYVGAPHFFGGGWGYGYGIGGHAPFPRPYGPWSGFGQGPYPNRPMPFNNGYGFNGPAPFTAGPYAVHDLPPKASSPVNGHAFAKSAVERVHKNKSKKKNHKHSKRRRHTRSLHKDHDSVKKSKRVKSKNRQHQGNKKHMVVMNRPSIVFHQPSEVYHRPDVVIHRPDILIHRPDIVMHQAPVVVHKPAVVFHQPPVVIHQPPPLVHQPVLYSNDAYAPHTYYEPFSSHVEHAGTYLGAPHAFGGGWGYGYGSVVGGFGKSNVEKSKSKKVHKAAKKDITKNKQVKATKKGDILHAAEEKTVNPDKKNDIVVSRPPIIYHPPPEVYHRPDIVVHRAPIVLHRPPIIYHQPPVVVHRPAVVYHQPPIIFHQPPPAVHQPILHSHDTFVVHHSALYEPHGSTLSHETSYIGIPSNVEQYDGGMEYEGMHRGGFHRSHGGFHGGFHGFHGGYHGEPGYILHRSNIEHVKKSSKENESDVQSDSEKSNKSKTEPHSKKDTDADKVKTRRRRQVLGSHSLFLTETPLNIVHPRGPIVERLQKMSTIPHAPDYEGHVSKKGVEPKREKRQFVDNPLGEQVPLNYLGTNALSRRKLETMQPVGPVLPDAHFMYPRLPYVQPLAQNPFFPGPPPFSSPGVHVHVETERSTIPVKSRKVKSRLRRQVLPYVPSQVLSAVQNMMLTPPPNLLNPQANAPFAVHPEPGQMPPQLPAQIPPQYLGFNGLRPMSMPYPLMNFAPRRPRVNINVQSARSNIPEPVNKPRRKRSGRRKRQLFSPNPYMNPYMMTPNSFPRGYGPFTMYPNYRMFNPYWNMNPYFFRRTPEIPHPHEDRDSNSPASQLNRYLTYLYELYTGELFHHRHPKVSVDVHTSKSDIPGSKPRDIVVRTRRQLLNYLPVSPLTTGQYHFPGMAFSRRVLPLKRSSMAKSKRSTKERVASRKIKNHEEKEINTKRDEFTRQRTENNEQNMIQMNPSSPGPTQFRNGEQNDQLPTLNAGAEGFNEIGPGGLNGVATEPQVDRPQAQGFYDGTAGQEQKMLNANEQQDFIQQQPQEQQQPMSDFQVNPNFAQLQGLQGESRMAVPDNENEMLQLRGQPPFLPPGGPLLPPSGQISAPFFPTEPEGLPQPMMPMMRPFAPYPFVPLPPFPLQPPFPLEPPFQPPLPPAQSFVPEPEPSAQPSVNVNINTIKSSLPRRKSKKDSSTTEKVVSRTVPDREHKRTNKRQSISLLRRIPALQVLPQTFLQDGVQIPSFSRTQTGKETRHHGVNGMVISELQRKHDIPSKSKSKQTAHKRQFYHLPFNVHQVQPVQPVQLVQPFLSPVTAFGFQQRPRVHVQVDIGKRKSDFSSNKDSNDTERKPNKVKRQIYGMNELPHGLKFSEEVTNLSNDKNLVKKFKIRSDGDMDTSDSSRAKTQKRHVDSSTQKPKNETSSKKISLMSKAATTDDADKRQFVLPFGGKNGQEYYGAHEEMQHVQQVPQQVEQVQPDSQQVEQQPFAQQVEQNEPQAMQNAAMTEQQAIDPQQMVQDQTQAYTNPLQQVGQGPFLARQPQVNVNVQVAKSDIGKSNGKKSLLAQLKNHKTKIVSRRQLFGTVPLLSPVVHADVNAVAREGNGRSSVPDTTATKHTRAKRQLGVAQPFAAPNQQYQSLGAEAQPFQPLSALPQPYVTTSPYQPGPRVNINVQTSRSSVHRHKRQLYDILSGQRAQAKKTNQPKVDLSRRSVSKQIHVKGARSIKKEKRQLQDLINNILERRRGPKLLQNMLKRPKPPIMFTTNNDNNPKPIDVFPGNRGGNNLGEGQPSPNDGGIGNPFAGLAPRPSPALQANQNPLGANLASPFRDTPVMQDDQPALTSQMQQRARTPLIAPEEPNGRQNIIQFLQNSGLPNAQLIPQQMNDEPPRMFQGPQFPGILPLPLPLPFLRPPEMGAPPVLGDQRSFAPFPPAPVVPPFGAQFPWRMYPMAPRPPPQFPYYPFAFPQMQPEFGNSPGPNEDNGDEDRPSVNVNVETSKSKIPKSKKS